MANSKYEYTRLFEQPDPLPYKTWIVIRLDGHSFHMFSNYHGFKKPSDERALHLMNAAARDVVRRFEGICVGYGHSDEYSFVFHPDVSLHDRRASKWISLITSAFSASYVHHWPRFFPDRPLSRESRDDDIAQMLPIFDGRAVSYPTLESLRDYLSWRQADCHINHLYNTAFWALVQQGGRSKQEAEKDLMGTVAADKHELLFSKFDINYNNEPELFKKGSVIFRDVAGNQSNGEYDQDRRLEDDQEQDPDTQKNPIQRDDRNNEDRVSGSSVMESRALRKKERENNKVIIIVENVDIIQDAFWRKRPWILEGKRPRMIE